MGVGLMREVPYSAEGFVADGVKKFVVLDFDGVLNTFYRCGTFKKIYYVDQKVENHPNPFYTNSRVNQEPKSYELQWSPRLVKDLNELLDADDVQLLWLTTWREHMQKVVERLHIVSRREQFYIPWDNYYYANLFSGSHLSPQFGKINGMEDFLGTDLPAGVRVVWADDVLGKYYLNEMVNTLNRAKVVPFLVAPEDSFGLTPVVMEDMKNFLSS